MSFLRTIVVVNIAVVPPDAPSSSWFRGSTGSVPFALRSPMRRRLRELSAAGHASCQDESITASRQPPISDMPPGATLLWCSTGSGKTTTTAAMLLALLRAATDGAHRISDAMHWIARATDRFPTVAGRLVVGILAAASVAEPLFVPLLRPEPARTIRLQPRRRRRSAHVIGEGRNRSPSQRQSPARQARCHVASGRSDRASLLGQRPNRSRLNASSGRTAARITGISPAAGSRPGRAPGTPSGLALHQRTHGLTGCQRRHLKQRRYEPGPPSPAAAYSLPQRTTRIPVVHRRASLLPSSR